MVSVISLFILIMISVAPAIFAYERGCEYVAKVQDIPKDVATRLAKLDLISYLLTSVPLIGALIILLSRDPGFIVHLPLPSAWNEVTTFSLALIASLGIGAGIARRRFALKVAASR